MKDLRIYIGRSGEVLATYSTTNLIKAIEDGIVLHTDQAWYKGLPNWLPVNEAIPPLLPLVPGRSRLSHSPYAEEIFAEGELPSMAS